MRNLRKDFFIVVSVLFCSFLFAAPVELTGGNLKLVLHAETGSFSLYQLSEIGKNRYEPLFEDRNFSTTSWFSVQSNGRIFKLAKKTGKPVVCEMTPAGAKFVFTLTDDFQVEQEFSFVNDLATGIPFGVRINTRIENTSGKEGTFALKAVVDTKIGESEGIHFFTNLRKRISSESRFVANVDSDVLIASQNKNVSLMFLLKGYNVTPVESLYVSNWDRLNTLTWIPEFIEDRSFNTLYSINDSALLFIWPEQKLQANEKIAVSMILGPYTPSVLSGPPTVQGSSNPAPIASQQPPSSKQVVIQQLLDRIAQIEANPSSASNDELRKLNESLDLMLKQTKE